MPARETAESLKTIAYNSILESVLSGRVRPGDIVNRREVAAELGTSVAPVLEAMVMLENEGFLEALPRRGTRVRVLRPEEIRGELIVREALECQAARMCCGKPIVNEIGRLTALATAAEEAAGSGEAGWRREVEFHREIVRLAGCAALVREYDKVMRLGLFFRINALVPHDPRSHDHHLKLLKRLAVRDPARAEEAMRAHVHVGREGFLAGWAASGA